MSRRSRILALGLVVSGTVVAGVTVLVAVTSRQGLGYEVTVPRWLVVPEMAVIAACVVGSWAAARHRLATGASLGLLTASLCLPTWAGWSAWGPYGRAWLLALVPLAIAAAALTLVSLEPPRPARARWLAGCVCCGIAACLILGLGRNPALELFCVRTCLNAPAALGDGLLSTGTAVWLSALLGAASAAFGAAAISRGSTSVTRTVSGVMAVAILASGPMSAAVAVGGSTWPVLAPFAGASIVAGTVLGLVADEARARRWLRNALRTLSADLLQVDGGSAKIQYAVPGATGEIIWVDDHGVRVAAPPAAPVWDLVDGSETAVRISDPPSGRSAPAMGDALTPALRLRLANARLMAVSRWRVRELQESQRRIVKTADAEARRIERDLHDGAQQRLVISALHIGLAKGKVPPGGALEDAAEAVSRATAGLRRIAHGAFPALLHTEGLDVAIDELRRAAAIRVTVAGTSPQPLPVDAASAAYAVATAVIDTATRAGAQSVSIQIGQAAGALRLTASTNPFIACDDALIDVSDRVGALGGSLTSSLKDEEWSVEAVIPCES